MKKTIKLTLYIFILFTNLIQAQEKCYSHKIIKTKNKNYEKEEEIKEKKLQDHITINKNKIEKRSIITIPVVVHVLYNSQNENISEEQIHSQLTVLNNDFNFKNENKLDSTHPFFKLCKEANIKFNLAKIDPKGNPTTGITRTYTTQKDWKEEEFDRIKFSDSSGVDNWDPTSYLNIWVANLDTNSTVLGFASFPDQLDSLPAYDGLVIRHQAFGTTGTVGKNGFIGNKYGRTATHEIGHWLNLWHIWGDEKCGDDLVADTEPADTSNFGCPDFPHSPNNSCGSSEYGEMYMNFMDYTDDDCMNMFTIGQIERMKGSLSYYRNKIMQKGENIASLKNITNNKQIQIYPNPNQGRFTISISKISNDNLEIILVDILGNKIKIFDNETDLNIPISIDYLQNGVYFLKINQEGNHYEIKVIINN